MSKKSKAGGGHVNLHKVSKKFDCAPGQVSFFTKKDPFNPENELSGYICRAEGKMGGSLFLTEVNGNKLNPEILIYGTPKLAYPYKDFESYELIVPICDKVFFSNKWNGMNVLVYKYKNAEGKVFLSCKSKGTPFLSNTPFGNFLDLAREAFGLSAKKTLTTAHKLLTILARDDVQSKTFELCGQKEPHLVKYDFDLELKPLFHTFTDGSIAPSIGELKETDFGPINYDTDKIVQICKEYQTNDLEANEAFRKANNLQAKYERGHFIREGRVMYCLNDKGRLIDRTMYKVKPKDIEEVHWSNFDVTMQGRVREAFEKIIEREKPVNAQSFKEELDMGPKEWDRFGQDILKYVESLPKGGLPSVKDDKRHVIMLIGLYGSGKSHVAKRIKENINCIVFDGDKAKPSALEKLREAKNNVTVVIDTCNVNPRKRKEFVSEIQKLGILESDAVVVNTKPEICKERLIAAKNVEHIQSGDFDAQLKTFRKPTPAEGFKHVHVINDNNEDELKNVLKALAENTKNNTNNNNNNQ